MEEKKQSEVNVIDEFKDEEQDINEKNNKKSKEREVSVHSVDIKGTISIINFTTIEPN